jgi:hypothetical protein
VIQQSVNAAERSRTPLAVLGIVQPGTPGKKSLVRYAVVPRQHLKMYLKVHVPEHSSNNKSARG